MVSEGQQMCQPRSFLRIIFEREAGGSRGGGQVSNLDKRRLSAGQLGGGLSPKQKCPLPFLSHSSPTFAIMALCLGRC